MAVSPVALGALAGGGMIGSALGAGSFIQAILTEWAEMPSIRLKGISALDGSTTVLPQQKLQFWPESLTDTLEVAYTPKTLPGASAALMQWNYNGGRTIAFEIRLLRDMQPEKVQKKNTSLFLAADPDSDMFGSPGRNISIPQMIAYLRAYCYPEYVDDGDFTKVEPPPICLLDVPGLHLNEDGSNVIWAVMTQCDVTYNKMWEGVDKEPQLKDVTVAVSFKQVIQNPGNVATPYNFKVRSDLWSDSAPAALSDEAQHGKMHGSGVTISGEEP